MECTRSVHRSCCSRVVCEGGKARELEREGGDAVLKLEAGHAAPRVESRPRLGPTCTRIYLSFFLGRSWLVCPHFFFRQLLARTGSRA